MKGHLFVLFGVLAMAVGGRTTGGGGGAVMEGGEFQALDMGAVDTKVFHDVEAENEAGGGEIGELRGMRFGDGVTVAVDGGKSSPATYD